MPFCLHEVIAPGIEPVPPQQETMRLRVQRQFISDAISQRRYVLGILEYRQPLALLVRFDSGQPFQHFVAFDGQTTFCKIKIRQHRAPNGMGMQNSTGVSHLHNHDMQRTFIRRLTSPIVKHLPAIVDQDNLAGPQRSFVDAACGNRQV